MRQLLLSTSIVCHATGRSPVPYKLLEGDLEIRLRETRRTAFQACGFVDLLQRHFRTQVISGQTVVLVMKPIPGGGARWPGAVVGVVF